MDPPRSHWIAILAATLFLAAYFLFFTAGSLRAEFAHDDLMNCYRAWLRTPLQLAVDNVLFFRFSPTYRPFGALLYKASFALFGFDLRPLRLLLLAALAGNSWLLHQLCRLLSGRAEIGLFAALVSAYHMKLWALYYNTGTLFDIFCFTFYFGASVCYVSARRRTGGLRVWQAAMVCTLYILALDSKEAAVSLPLVLLLYETLWHWPAATREAWRVWLRQPALMVGLAALITVAYVKGRVFHPVDGLGSIGGYEVTISPTEYLSKVAFYLNELTYSTDWFDATRAMILLLALLSIAVVSRSRIFLFGILLFLTGMLPLAFIPARTLSAIYIPLAGLAVCAAVSLGFVWSLLLRLSPRPGWQSAAFLVVFLGTGASLTKFHDSADAMYAAMSNVYGQIRNSRVQLRRLHRRIPYASRVLILATPFPEYSPGFQNLFLIRLLYEDQSLIVEERAQLEQDHQPVDLAAYDYVISYERRGWVDVRRKKQSARE